MAKFISNDDGQKIFQLDFENGWTASALKRWDGDYMNVALAAWPTSIPVGKRKASTVELGASEASDDEVLRFFKAIADKGPYIK